MFIIERNENGETKIFHGYAICWKGHEMRLYLGCIWLHSHNLVSQSLSLSKFSDFAILSLLQVIGKAKCKRLYKISRHLFSFTEILRGGIWVCSPTGISTRLADAFVA